MPIIAANIKIVKAVNEKTMLLSLKKPTIAIPTLDKRNIFLCPLNIPLYADCGLFEYIFLK